MKYLYIILLLSCFSFNSCLNGDNNPALHYKSNSSLDDKLKYSKFDWEETKAITLELSTPNDGIVNVRAINGEILYQGFLANGILSEFILNIPKELDQVLVEYEDNKELVSVGAKRIRFTF